MCMWAICNTSTKWSPYNPSDGFHPIFHFILRISHEQESLMIDRHLFSVPCTTWKKGYESLLACNSEESKQCWNPPKSWINNSQIVVLIGQFYVQLLLMCCSTHQAWVGKRWKQKCVLCIIRESIRKCCTCCPNNKPSESTDSAGRVQNECLIPVLSIERILPKR